MAKRKDKKRRQSRIDFIERKCDRILSELLIIRRQLSHRPDMDAVIDSMHRTARKLRIQAECDRELLNHLSHSFPQV